MAAEADRNLLFGVLALQAGLIDPDKFARACALWADRNDTPLPDLLVAQGWLAERDRTLVDQLVARKLRPHGDELPATLAAAGAGTMGFSLHGADEFAADPTEAGTTPAEGGSAGETAADAPHVRGRYRLVRLHAKGGIGRVWLARDEDLGREVALKELRPGRAGAAALARFLDEARITGQLEHPGVVPVHELVPDPAGGKPFYTMRFINGRTLADAVRAYHRKRRAWQTGPLDLRELLTAFVAVCNAVAYAHARGVIHRDLKPSNVVLGDFGEVIVLDWGLAKVLGREEVGGDNPPPVAAAPGDSRGDTVQGQVLGTPGYMPPEQAEGRLDLLEPRSDVYGLGAVLYEILTGQPPFAGGDTLQVLRRVATEPPVPPRKLVPALPPALEAVCLKALAKKPAGRYASARALAQEATQWLADEPVAAYREPVADRLRRWRRRHPTVTAVAALLALALAAGGVWLKQEWDARAVEAARREAAVQADLDEAAARRRQEQWPEARAAVARAEGRLAGGVSAGLAGRVRQAAAELDMVAALEDIRLRKAQVRGGGADFAVADEAYARAFAGHGLPVLSLDPKEAARRLARSAIQGRLVVALDDWADSVPEANADRKERLLAVVAAVDEDPWRRELRRRLARPERAALEELAGRPEAAAQPPDAVVLLARALRRTGGTEAAAGLLRRAQERHPGDFWLNHSLGLYLVSTRPPRLEEAVGFLRAAVAARPQSSLAHGNLGYALSQLGRAAEAEAEYRKVAMLQPDNVLAHSNLGSALIKQDRLAEAEAVLRRAAALEPGNLLVLYNLAEAVRKQGRYADALALYQAHAEAASRDPAFRGPWADARREAERLAALAEKLPDVLAGRARPADAGERAALARVCLEGPRRLPAAAARLYREAFAAEPALADDLGAQHRTNAACAAARAAGGQGEDAAGLGEPDRAGWRRQALEWLRADLAAWARKADGGKPEDRAAAQKALQHWQGDADLAGLRDEAALAKLPEGERAACRQFWRDVAALLQKWGGP
jgi:Flp pilus assembly protein TadD